MVLIKRVYLTGTVEKWLSDDMFIRASGWRGRLREDFHQHGVQAVFSHAVSEYFLRGPSALQLRADARMAQYEMAVKLDFPKVTHADALVVFGAAEGDDWLEFTLRDVAWAYGRLPIVLTEDGGATLPHVLAMASATFGALDDALEFTLHLPALHAD